MATKRKTEKSTKQEQPKKNRLRELRTKMNLTMEEVAKVIDRDLSTVSRHESGDRGLTQDDVRAYAKLFKVDSLAIFMDPAEFAPTK